MPDVTSFDPSWHHNYATLGFTRPSAPAPSRPHYPPTDPALVPLVAALQKLGGDAGLRARFRQDPQGVGAAADLRPVDIDALQRRDWAGMIAMGVHPLVIFFARMQFEKDS